MNSFKIKLTICILLLMFLFTALGALKYRADKNAGRFYKQGMHFYNKGNYSDAYYNFKQINYFSDLYEVALLKQYICAYKLEDKKTAHAKLTDLIMRTNDKNIRPYAMYNEAILAIELGLNSKNQSIKKFQKIVNNYSDNDFKYASAFKLAKLSDNKYSSKENYIEYLKYAPIGKFALTALENVTSMKDILKAEDNEIIAQSYYLNSKYEDALNFYKNSDFSKNWFQIAKCYRALNKKEEEKKTLEDGLNLNYSEIEEKDIDSALNRLISLKGVNKIQFLQDIENQNSKNYIYPTALYNLAEASQGIRAVKLYEQIAKNYPNSSWASNSLWELLWYNYSQEHYKNCIKIGDFHQKKYPDSIDAPRVLYWTARALLKEKNNQNARDLFYKVIKDYPLSYYSFLSARQLKISKAKNIIVKKPLATFNIDKLNKFIFKDDKILMFLANNNDYEAIEELKINDEYIKAWIMFKKENYPNSINTAKNEYLKNLKEQEDKKASYSDKELKLIYPVLFEDEINKYATEYKQSPYLFISIIREESHFNQNALSSAGATGLVQLMPATASFIENSYIDTDMLKQDNIKIGIKYFNYLMNLFDNNEYYAILSYNAGPGNVKKWLNNQFIKNEDVDEFVENIPFLETKNYIKKVLSSYWIYYNIYK